MNPEIYAMLVAEETFVDASLASTPAKETVHATTRA
jgi:hypothetical protein